MAGHTHGNGILARIAPALSHRNFRLYIAGQAVSVTGSWIQTVAISWTLYTLTDSATLLGLAAFLVQGPQLLLTPAAGAWIENRNRWLLLLLVQIANAALAFTLALMFWRNLADAPTILLASAVLGLLNSFDTPLRQSLLCDLVNDRADLSSAIALNASIFTGGRFLGPPLAGLLLATSPPAACFFINGLSFTVIIGALLLIDGRDQPTPGGPPAPWFQALLDGLRLSIGTPSIHLPLAQLCAVNMMASSALVLAPLMVGQTFQAKPDSLGWLLGTAGAGALSATFLMAGKRNLADLSRLLRWAPYLGVAGLFLIGGSRNVQSALIGMFAVGASVALTNVTTNAILQGTAAAAFRTRIIALFAAVRFGTDALGSLLTGMLAGSIGPHSAISLAAAALLGLSLWLTPRLRRLQFLHGG